MSPNRVAGGVLLVLVVAVGCARKPAEQPSAPNGQVVPDGPQPAGTEAAPMPRSRRFVGFKSVSVTPGELASLVSYLPEPIGKLYGSDAACFTDLDGKAFAWEYAGGPIRLWLEFEEKGQSTVPERFPLKADDWLAKGETGHVVFWVRRGVSDKINAALKRAGKPEGATEAVGLGVTVSSSAGGMNGSIAYDNPLWFGWVGHAFDDRPWAEVALPDYVPTPVLVLEARERKGGNREPRNAKLTLKVQRVKPE